jgi:hypothetical protein
VVERVPREHCVGRVAFVLVAEESGAHCLDALLAHCGDHGFRHVDGDDLRHMRRYCARKRARTSPEVKDGARCPNPERSQGREVIAPVSRRLLVVRGDISRIDVLGPSVRKLIEPPGGWVACHCEDLFHAPSVVSLPGPRFRNVP